MINTKKEFICELIIVILSGIIIFTYWYFFGNWTIKSIQELNNFPIINFLINDFIKNIKIIKQSF